MLKLTGEVAELVDGARLESVYTPKGYHGFESHPLRKPDLLPGKAGHFYFQAKPIPLSEFSLIY